MKVGNQKKELTAVERAAMALARHLDRGGHGVKDDDIKKALEQVSLEDTREVRRVVMNLAQEMNWGQKIFLGG